MEIIHEGYLWPQELKYCGYLCPNIIFRYHILLKSCTCDRILNSLYSAHTIALVSRFTCNIIVQFKLQFLSSTKNPRHNTIQYLYLLFHGKLLSTFLRHLQYWPVRRTAGIWFPGIGVEILDWGGFGGWLRPSGTERIIPTGEINATILWID